MVGYDIYSDISSRTGGDMYIGVVGPVRTGKSTFISKFMEKLVVPNINNKLQKQIATDEFPQSADGKTIMTTQPKFVPANAVRINFKNKASANVRLVDCVGYFVDGAVGSKEDEKDRLVKTPWTDEEIPFEKAAEIGTKKVIKDYSTIGIVVTTDGSFTDIPRNDYITAEEKVIDELKKLNKPFIILLNSKNPTDDSTIKLSKEMEEKYKTSTICINALELNAEDIGFIMEKVLLEFPMSNFNINLPKWMQYLSVDNEIIKDILDCVRKCSNNICKMKDFSELDKGFEKCDKVCTLKTKDILLDTGKVEYELIPRDGLFYEVLSKECQEEINDDYKLLTFIKSFSENKKKYDKIKLALENAENTGYGVVSPSSNDMELEEPALVKRGKQYGVKFRAKAPSLHIIKVDVNTEVSPIVGTEEQGIDLVNTLVKKFEEGKEEIFKTNMFGKTLEEMLSEGLCLKVDSMPKDVQAKITKTMGRIINENRGGILCLLL